MMNKSSTKQKNIVKNVKIHSARRILEQYGNLPPETLNRKQKFKIKWAKSFLQGFNGPDQAKTVAIANRQTSLRKIPPAKNSRVTTTEPTLLNLNKVIAIMRKCSNCISPRKWKIVDSILASVYLQVMKDNPGEPPHCKDMGWHDDRYKLIGCANDRSVFLLTVALKEAGKQMGDTTLVAAYKEDLIAQPHAVACFPSKPSDIKTMLEIINTNNPNLFVERWKILQVDEVINGWKQVIFKLDPLSMIPLKESNNTIHYVSGTVHLYVYRNEVEKFKILNFIKDNDQALMKHITDLNRSDTSRINLAKEINAIHSIESENIQTVQASVISNNEPATLNTEPAHLMEMETEIGEPDVICVDDNKRIDVIVLDDDDCDEKNIKTPSSLSNKSQL